MTPKADFFISYSRQDKAWAEWLGWILEHEGYATKIQEWDIAAGQNFIVEMHKANNECERTVLVLSTAYQASQYAQAEWTATFAKDPTGEQGLLIPFRVEDCAVNGLLASIVRTDLFTLAEEDARHAVLAAVRRGRRKPQTPPKFPLAVAQSKVAARPPFPEYQSGVTVHEVAPSTDEDKKTGWDGALSSGPTTDARLEGLSQAFADALADLKPSSRRKAVKSLLEQVAAVRPKSTHTRLFACRLYRATAQDATTVGDAQRAWDQAMDCAIAALEGLGTDVTERRETLHLLSELAVDYAQTGLQIGVEVNRLVKFLNKADHELGQDIFAFSTFTADRTVETRAVLLTQRSKINRALAKLRHLRGTPGTPRHQRSVVEQHRTNALRYAEAAIALSNVQPCRFERVLARFAGVVPIAVEP